MTGSREGRYILLGIPALFLSAAAFHFLYGWSGGCPAVGLIAPVNESVFEHMKMLALPTALWWGVYALVRRKELRAGAWLTGGLAAAAAAALMIPLLFYFYTGALGREIFWVDLAVTLLAATGGQLLGRHVYVRGRGMSAPRAAALTVCFILALALLTVFPLRIPMFRDPASGICGIA